MIQNERQYKVTQTKLKELEQASDLVKIEDSTLHSRQILSERNSYNKIIRTLKQEITEYEDLKSGRIAVFPIESFDDLPTALIKARIASGMTQKDLAERIDTQEQQIQRYEANHYQAISFDQLIKVIRALGISFKHDVEIEIESLKSLV